MLIFRYNWLMMIKEATQLAEENYMNISICEQVLVLAGLMNGTLNNKYTKKQYHASLRLLAEKDKPNFLLNAYTVFTYNKASVEDKCLLLFLASKRNYSDYALKGISAIPYALVENTLKDYDWENNPLLELDGDIINFKLKK